MINLVVDSNNVLGKFVEEAGKYNVVVLPSSTAKTSSSGNEMAVLDFEVIDGQYAGGQIRFANYVWNDTTQEDLERSVKRFNTLLVAIGTQDGQNISTTIQNFVAGMVGKTLNISVDWEEYNGKYNLKVRGTKPVDPDGSKPNGVKRPDGNNTNGVATSTSKQTSDPFANNNNTIDISDDDLPF